MGMISHYIHSKIRAEDLGGPLKKKRILSTTILKKKKIVFPLLNYMFNNVRYLVKIQHSRTLGV